MATAHAQRSPLQNKLRMSLTEIEPACSGSDHVQDASGKSLFFSPQFSGMDEAAKKKIAEEILLSPTTCILIRSTAKKNQLQNLVIRCDSYINSMLPEMLGREAVLSLPRIQVNVIVSSGTFELTSDFSVIEDVVPKVIRNLEDGCSAHLEEKVLQMYLEGDCVSTTPRSSKMLSPEKPDSLQTLKKKVPSPARRLFLDDSFEDDSEPTQPAWKIVSTHKMSTLSAVCMVELNSSLVVVSVVLVLDNLSLPVSPTTGLPFPDGINFMTSMSVARSGFGVVPFEGSLLSVGGFNRDGCVAETERYNYTQNCWDSACDLNMPRARFGVAILGDTVFAIGGSDGRRELSSMETLSSKSQKWQKHESKLITPRSCFGTTTLNGRIYVVGGLHYSSPLKTAEIFNPSLNRWEALPSMNTWRRDVAVTSCLGKVYAIGGQTSGWSCLASVECFDPTTRKWSKVPSMTTPRRNATAVTLEDKIYVIGGYNGSTAVRHVEVYDPTTNTWSQSSPLNTKRSYAAATVVDDTIYVVGGYANSSFLNSIEKFTLQTNQWTPFV